MSPATVRHHLRSGELCGHVRQNAASTQQLHVQTQQTTVGEGGPSLRLHAQHCPSFHGLVRL